MAFEATVVFVVKGEHRIELPHGLYFSDFLRFMMEDTAGSGAADVVDVDIAYKGDDDVSIVDAVKVLVAWMTQMHSDSRKKTLLASPLFRMDETTYLETINMMRTNQVPLETISEHEDSLCVKDVKWEAELFESCKAKLRSLLLLSVYLDVPMFYRRLLYYFGTKIYADQTERIETVNLIRRQLCPHVNSDIYSSQQWFDFLRLSLVNPSSRNLMKRSNFPSASPHEVMLVDQPALPHSDPNAVMMESFDGSLLTCSVCGCCIKKEEFPAAILQEIGCQRIAASEDALFRYAQWIRDVTPLCPSTDVPFEEYDTYMERLIIAHDVVSEAERSYFRRWQELLPSLEVERAIVLGERVDEEVLTHLVPSYMEILCFTKDLLFLIHLETLLSKWRGGEHDKLLFLQQLLLPRVSRDAEALENLDEVEDLILRKKRRGFMAGDEDANRESICERSAFYLCWLSVEFVWAHHTGRPLPFGRVLEPVVKRFVPPADATELERTHLLALGGELDEVRLGMRRRNAACEYHDSTVFYMYRMPVCIASETSILVMSAILRAEPSRDADLLSRLVSTPMVTRVGTAYMLDMVCDPDAPTVMEADRFLCLYKKVTLFDESLTDYLVMQMRNILSTTDPERLNTLEIAGADIHDYCCDLAATNQIKPMPVDWSMECYSIRLLQNIQHQLDPRKVNAFLTEAEFLATETSQLAQELLRRMVV